MKIAKKNTDTTLPTKQGKFRPPKWFYYSLPPTAPAEPKPPSETYEVRDVVKTFDEYSTQITKASLMEIDFDEIDIRHRHWESDSCDFYFNLVKLTTKKKTAAQLKREMKSYNQRRKAWLELKADYDTKAEQWPKIKAKIDAQNREAAAKAEKQLLKKLKAKYET